MIIDICREGNYLVARPRCTIKECEVKLEITDPEKDSEKIERMAIDRFYEMANKYYTKGFTNKEIFQAGNIIELRNGVRYRIQEGVIKSCWEFNEDKKLMEAIAITKTQIKRLIDASWDEFGFYGVNTSMDIVKVFDRDMNLKAKRTQYNVLSSKNLEKMKEN